MHPVMRSDFLNGLLFLDGLQRDSCFHFRAEAPPLPRFHFYSLSEAAILHLNEWSEFWGALHSSTACDCSYPPRKCPHNPTISSYYGCVESMNDPLPHREYGLKINTFKRERLICKGFI